MADALLADFPYAREWFDRASTVLGYDLPGLMRDAPDGALNRTEKTQPALLAQGAVTWQVLREETGATPRCMAGHSLGEYTALVCAGVLEYETTIRLVEARGRCMQTAVAEGEGVMSAILGLEDEQVSALCAQYGGAERVAVANYNAPRQVVVAGLRAAVEQVEAASMAAGARRAVRLSVSAPSHCALMRPAARRFAEHLRELTFAEARIPVVQNVDAVARMEAEAIKPKLLEQLYSPVRWVDTIKTMRGFGVELVVECGPGQVLCGLIKRIERAIQTLPLVDRASLDKLPLPRNRSKSA